jgi:hypothetical protein
MRLINTSTLELHEFFGTKTPAYAILSHFWGDDEVTFHDLRDGTGPQRQGWGKVFGCCDKALEDGWEFVVSLLLESISMSLMIRELALFPVISVPENVLERTFTHLSVVDRFLLH